MKTTDKQANKRPPSLWQRFRQFQPSQQLVKIMFLWWLLVVLVSALRLTHGFGIEGLVALANGLTIFCYLLLAIIVLVTVLDILMLMAMSQTDSYQIKRHYPSNVAIFHDLDIDVILNFFPEKLNKFCSIIFAIIKPKQINLEFFDDYPDQLQVADGNMPIQLMMTLSNSVDSQDTADQQQPEPTPTSNPTPKLSSKLSPNQNQASQSTTTASTATFSKKISYPTLPMERGTGFFADAELRVVSPLKLFQRQFFVQQDDYQQPQHQDSEEDQQENQQQSTKQQATKKQAKQQPKQHVGDKQSDKQSSPPHLRVLADFTGLLNNELSAVFEKGFDAGIQTLKEQGQGSEFLKLREYALGDSMRQVDWKASSRQGRLMSKSYEDENDQDVVFLLDCSEQMRHQQSAETMLMSDNSKLTANQQTGVKQLSYFDKVLNAVLLLSYVANKQGDRVGLMTFGAGSQNKFVPPQKGASLIRHLLDETADIKPTMRTSDYFKASEALRKSVRKRSLIIVITNTRQEANDEMIQAMQLISRFHQLVFANLTEQSVQDMLTMSFMPVEMDDALLYHSLIGYQQTRNKLHQRLKQKTGSMCLATTANKLPVELTEAYLRVRNR